jgi:hypothetical protein
VRTARLLNLRAGGCKSCRGAQVLSKGLVEQWRAPFFLHVDELQSFGTDAFASLLSEARKFATHFVLANQSTEKPNPDVRAAVLGDRSAPRSAAKLTSNGRPATETDFAASSASFAHARRASRPAHSKI